METFCLTANCDRTNSHDRGPAHGSRYNSLTGHPNHGNRVKFHVKLLLHDVGSRVETLVMLSILSSGERLKETVIAGKLAGRIDKFNVGRSIYVLEHQAASKSYRGFRCFVK